MPPPWVVDVFSATLPTLAYAPDGIVGPLTVIALYSTDNGSRRIPLSTRGSGIVTRS